MRHLFTFMIILLFSSSAFASGFAVKDQGTKAMSLGNAFTGVADDTTAAWYNPAALVFQDGVSVTAGGQVVIPTVDYTAVNGTTYSMDKKNHVIPFGYVSYNLEDSPVAFSLVVNAPFGLSTDWTNSGAPFTSAQTPANPTGASKSLTFSEIRMINVNPSVAYQINENLSVAVGVMYFDATNVAFDSTAVTQHGSGNGWGGNAAIFYKSDSFDAGLSYRSSVKVDVTGTATGGSALAFAGLNGVSSSVNTSFTTPDMVSGGISFHPVDNVLVSAQVDWVNWKTFDQLKFNYGTSALNAITGSSQTAPENWKATTSFALGTEWSLQEDMHLRAGYAFDPTPVSSVEFSPRITDNDRHFFTVGYGQDFSSGTLNIAYGYILVKDINQTASATTPPPAGTQRNGTYKANIHVLSADYTLRF